MNIETKFISPELAETYLATSSANRNVSHTRVLTLASEMNAGKWQLNGQTIVISDTGKLLDGQHRLFAIVEHGKPVQMTVVTGVDEKSFHTIDTGKSRSSGDIAGMAGIANPNLVTAAAAMIWRLYHGCNINEACPSVFSIQVVGRYPALKKWAPFVAARPGGAVLPPASLLAALVYLEDIAKKPQAAETFFAKITKGTDLEEGSPYLALRNRIMNLRASGGIVNGPTCWYSIARTLSAIEAGETLQRLPIQRSHGTVARPALWTEHINNLEKGKRLDDMRPGAARTTGGSQRIKFQERISELRALAEDKRKVG